MKSTSNNLKLKPGIFLLILSLIFSACAPNVDQLLTENDIEGLVEALNHKDSSIRQSAAEALGTLGGPASINALAIALSDVDPDVRGTVAKSLGQTDDETNLPLLLEALKEEKNQDVQGKLSDVIISYEDKAVEPIIGYLGTESEDFHSLLLSAIEKIGESAIPKLIEAIPDSDPQIQEGIQKALVNIGSPAADELIDLLGSEDSDLRQFASNTLVDMGTPVLDLLIQALADPNLVRRENLVAVIAKLGEPAVDPLIESLGVEKLTTGAKSCLVEIGKPAVKPLIEALSVEGLRTPAEKTLIEMKEVAVSDLIESYDLNPEKTEQLLKTLVYGLLIKNCTECDRISEILEEIGEPAAPVIMDMMNDKYSTLDAIQKSSIRQVLLAVGEPGVSSMIDAYGKRPDISLLHDVIIEMGSSAIPELQIALESGYEQVRKAAVSILAEIDDDKAHSSIIEALTNRFPIVRVEAAQVLGQLRLEESVEPLIHALQDSDESVINAAFGALVSIDRPAVDALLKAYHEETSENAVIIDTLLFMIYVENKQETLELANKVCEGQAQPQAAAYNRYASDYHPIIFVGEEGKAIMEEEIPVDWLPYSPEDLELVVCFDERSEEVVEVCNYVPVSGSGLGFSKTRYRQTQKITIRSANGAYIIGTTSLRGTYPDACPQTVSNYSTSPIIGYLSDDAVWDWLKAYGISWGE